METKSKYWRITDFAKEISNYMNTKYQTNSRKPHYNTVDKWFKNLEELDIHYLNRVAGEKVYDSDDFEKACFIFEGRQKGLPLNMLFEKIAVDFECRPAPNDEVKSESQMISEQQLERMINSKLEAMTEKWIELIQEVTEKKVKQEIESIKAFLPAPEDREQEKKDLIASIERIVPNEKDILDKVKELIPDPKDQTELRNEQFEFNQKVEIEIKRRALIEWDKQPDNIKYTVKGFFKKVKEENSRARDNFIDDYRIQHYREVSRFIASQQDEESSS